MDKFAKIDYIRAHRFKGFDELAQDLTKLEGAPVTKAEVKDLWNEAKLGFKYIPRTLVQIEPQSRYHERTGFLAFIMGRRSLKRIYVLKDDVVIFLDPVTPRVIPAGFETDMGSVPTWARWIVQKDDPRFLYAFYNHDLDYVLRWTSRGIADARLLFFAKQSGAPFVQRWIVYFAVRIGGFFAWRNKTEMKIAERNHAINLVHEATTAYEEKQNGVLLSVAKKYYV